MVVNNIEEIMDALVMVEGKGDPMVVAGTTESGKSTAMNALAKNEDVQELLSKREAYGKGSTSEMSIIATDYSAIPEDKLIMTAKLQLKSIADCGDDNDLIGSIIYSGAKDYSKNPNMELYKSKLLRTLNNALEHPANESLAYKLKGMKNEDVNSLIDILMQLPINDVMSIYNEMLAKNHKKGQNGVRIFTELLSDKQEFSDIIKDYWNFVVELINRDVSYLRTELEKNGAVVKVLDDETSKFVIVLGLEDIESEIVNVLLKSEEGSKEYLFSDTSLIFRGADYLFDVNNNNLLMVSEYQGEQIHCIRFIDTQGLFHATGVKTKDESERIIDILSEYHSNKLILVVSSFVTDTVKDGYEAIRLMLQEANREIEVYILYTHWDEYLKSYSQQSTKTGRFNRGIVSIDWSARYDEALKDQSLLSDTFNSCINTNVSKRKPMIIGFYRAAILSDPESKMEDELEKHNVIYPVALHKLIEDVLKEEAKRGQKNRVLEGIEDCFSINISQFGRQNISALFDNLVGECKGLKLYAATVRACNSKWCSSGTVHKSDVAVNNYGFKNIETCFVQEIRNYAMTCVGKIDIDVSPYIPDPSNIKRFTDDLKEYLIKNQNVGREVAKLIGNEAYRNGFIKETGFRYQYERFTDMIQYVQDNYFMAKSIPFTLAFERCLSAALKECISNFVDAKCIVVY